MVNSLRNVDFSHPTGHYTWKKFGAPLEKILGAPLCIPLGIPKIVTRARYEHLLAERYHGRMIFFNMNFAELCNRAFSSCMVNFLFRNFETAEC